MITTAITSALQRFGPRGRAERMAHEFGDHREAASPNGPELDDLCAASGAGSAIAGRAESIWSVSLVVGTAPDSWGL